MKTTLFLLGLTFAAISATNAHAMDDIRIIVKTNKGDIEATLFASKAPLTVANYLNLAKHGYYDGLTFHRVIPNFMIQGGDPTGTGMGGPGYKFEDEVKTGLNDGKRIEIVSGLEENETVLIVHAPVNVPGQTTNPFMPKFPARRSR